MSREAVLDMLRRQAEFDTRGSMIGSALIGGTRSKGIRKCVARKKGPSGKVRCSKWEQIAKAAALIGGTDVGGMMLGEGVKGRKCARFTKKTPSGQKRCAKYFPIGHGCGMCGACGGVLKEAPDPEYSKEVRQLAKVFPQAAANYCPPFDVLTEGENKLPLDALKSYVREMEGLKDSATLKEWRKANSAAAKQREALQMVGQLFASAQQA
jgi:hypothetical protein